MKYEIITREFDDQGRFCGLVEVFSDDTSWRSGVARVSIGKPVDPEPGVALNARKTALGLASKQAYNGPNPTSAEILAGLQVYADDHQVQIQPVVKVVPTLPVGLISAGVVVAPARDRDATGKEILPEEPIGLKE